MKLCQLILLLGSLSCVAQAVPRRAQHFPHSHHGAPHHGWLPWSSNQTNSTSPSNDSQWDAIIVGAGTAGIIVADRLSEAGKKTLLLELGGPSYYVTGGRERPDWLDGTNLSRVDVPGLYSSIFSGGSSLLCSSGVVAAFQGCTVGGNSAINAGLYFQPPASDWDDYYPDGWKSPDVASSADRLLQRQPSVVDYSQDGELYLQSGYQAAEQWLVTGAGFTELSVNDEPDDKDRVFGRPAYDYMNGQRGGPATTYLQTALTRPNFKLMTGTQVQYIVRDGQTATGVVAKTANGTLTFGLSPDGRIVLSAGAIVSPSILFKSGIGPQDVLTDYSNSASSSYNNESSWIVNGDIGEGLFDNPNTFIELSAPIVDAYSYDYNNPLPDDRDLYLNERSGPYSFAGQTSVFWSYVNNSDGSRTGIQGTIGTSGYAGYTDNNTITLNVYGTSGMASSGRVTLSSDGSYTPAPSGAIYYGNPRDGQAIASSIYDIFQALPDSTPSEPATDGLTPLNIPRRSTLEEIEQYITTWSPYAVGSVQHWTSSCRIGKCVDENAQVIGTSNIHVVDASIIAPPTVNPQFAVMVAAEHASANILAL